MTDSTTILVVDDEKMLRNLLQKILQKEGFRVLTAETGAEALTHLSSESIDLVISDVQMPVMDGFELLKAIKANHPEVGVIVMTAYGDAYTVRDALLLGADEYITKPFKNFEVMMVVERANWRRMSTRNTEKVTANSN